MTEISNPKILKMLKSSGWLKNKPKIAEEQNNHILPRISTDASKLSSNSQKFTCAVCGLPTLTCCSVCKSTFYCSSAHQNLHWPKHKAECSLPEEPISSQRNGTFTSNNLNHSSTTVPKNLSESGGSFTSQSHLEKKNSINFAQKPQEGVHQRNSAINSMPTKGNDEIFSNRLNTGASIQEIESEESESSEEPEQQQSAYEMQMNEITKQAALMSENHNNNTSFGSKGKFISSNSYQMSLDVSNSQNVPKGIEREKIQESPMTDTRANQNKSEIASTDETNEVFFEERRKLLRDILKNVSQNQLESAALKCKKLVKLSDQIFYRSEHRGPTLVCADYLLFARCLIKLDRIQEARNELLHLKRFVIEHVPDGKIDYRKGKESDRVSVRLINTRKEFLNFLTDDNITLTKKKAILDILQERTNIYSTLANLFYNIGDWNSCEEMYVKYTKITENNFGEDSFEAGNCYFVTGVFYLQHKYYLKAMACFKRSFAIRAKRLGGENFDIIADCYYNIGLVYKQTGNQIKSIYALNQALEIRATVIGETSLPVAQCLEILGKVYAEKGDYKSAFTRFNDCLELRKLQLNKKDPQLKRAQKLLFELYERITHELTQTRQPKKTRETYEYIAERLNEILKGVKVVTHKSDNSMNKAFVTSKIYNNGERLLVFQKDSQNNSMNHSKNMKEPNTPPSDKNNESYDKISETEERRPTFTDSAFNDEGRGRSNPERNSIGALFVKNGGKLGSARDKSPKPLPNLAQIADFFKTKNQANLNFQLKVDNSIVMGMSSDQLMQMVQLQSRLRTAVSIEEAQRILMLSAFYKSLSLNDKVVFKSSNPEYFKPLNPKFEAIFTNFIQKIANNDPVNDFKPIQTILPAQKEHEQEEPEYFRSSRSNAMKPMGSRLRGIGPFSDNQSMDEEGNLNPSQSNIPADVLKSHDRVTEQENPEKEPSGDITQTKRFNDGIEENSRDNSVNSSDANEQLGKYKLQRQILQSVKANTLFKGGLRNLKAKLSEKQ